MGVRGCEQERQGALGNGSLGTSVYKMMGVITKVSFSELQDLGYKKR